jgi:hypothetical protein
MALTVSKGTLTVVTVSGLSGPASGTHDFSIYLDTSTWSFGSDVIDITTYGKSDHVFSAALKNGKWTMGGKYDTSITSAPWWILSQANGQTATIVLKPEGTGSGKPSHSFSAVLESYNQTAAVADFVMWDSSWSVSDAVTSSIQ